MVIFKSKSAKSESDCLLQLLELSLSSLTQPPWANAVQSYHFELAGKEKRDESPKIQQISGKVVDLA